MQNTLPHPRSSPAAWVKHPWLGFDTETTGVNTDTDRLVTAAAVVRTFGESVEHRHTWLANPGVPIPPGATRIHGISTEHARAHGLPPTQVLEELNARLAAQMMQGAVVVVFNAGYDLPLLHAESKRHGVATLTERLGGPVAPVVDPLVLDRALVVKRRGKRRLSDLAAAYKVQVPQDTHQAHVDASLTLDLLAAMVQAHPRLAEMEAGDLHRFQQESHAAWAADFEAFLHSRGRQTRISRTWF